MTPEMSISASMTSRSFRPWCRFRNSRTWSYTLPGALIEPKYLPSAQSTTRFMIEVPHRDRPTSAPFASDRHDPTGDCVFKQLRSGDVPFINQIIFNCLSDSKMTCRFPMPSRFEAFSFCYFLSKVRPSRKTFGFFI